MRRLILLATASILIALPASAHADLDLTDPAAAAAIAAGELVWADNPCAGTTTYRYVTDAELVAEHPDDPDPAGVLGYAPMGGAARGNCTLTIALKRHWTGSDLCQVVAHEHGHLLGLDHTDDPADLMYPYLRPDAEIYGCARVEALASERPAVVEVTVAVLHRPKAPKRKTSRRRGGGGFENGQRPGFENRRSPSFEDARPRRSNKRPRS